MSHSYLVECRTCVMDASSSVVTGNNNLWQFNPSYVYLVRLHGAETIAENFPPIQNDVFLKAIRGEDVPYTPVWIMRQAGRYLPEFRALRAENEFFRVCRTPELACEITLQPIRRLPLDAAIIFSDILVVPQAMGLEVIMVPGKGPVFPSPLLTPEEIDTRLVKPDVKKELSYVFQALTLTRHRLEGKVPLIGFSGAPWTLMSYMIEGGGSKTFAKSKKWLYQYPEASHKLLDMLSDIIIEYLSLQIQAGAQAVQVFDSWAGELSLDVWDKFGIPYLTKIGSQLRKLHPDTPLILFAKGASHGMKLMSEMEYNVLGVDWTANIREARALTRPKNICLQGNMDPAVLYADKSVIRGEVERILDEFGLGLHVANLGHGLHPEHNPEHVAAYIEAVHELSAAKRQ
ncbi:uroporphyrinogen decarboxylase [Planoprotostelium fungivorum]|uniref:Uroporphyrinogen decarboxylase n=1 Tax=Planoprotostelium fungivorum TaxID=1890364 RepID=A0A2P6NEK2_9EUKA|nr:uroporphyrinogen decarboxylase [Planoprotostelium fungivorum]